jgi:hypothetical protein
MGWEWPRGVCGSMRVPRPPPGGCQLNYAANAAFPNSEVAFSTFTLTQTEGIARRGKERECCLLVLNSVTATPQWIRQPEAAWGCE